VEGNSEAAISSKAVVWTPLETVLVTHKLNERPTRSPDDASLSQAIQFIEESDDESPKVILQRLVDSALDLCRADSAGVSILEDQSARPQFRWHAIAGRFASNVGGGMPRWSSPCGTVLDRNCALLFQRPENHFSYQTLVDPPIVEALLVPFHIDGKPVGTVWVIAHNEQRKFDNEDVRILKSLTHFAARAVQAMVH
jgi:GAF domain-containing protein